VKDWGPQGYGKYNRKYSAAGHLLGRQGEMPALGAWPDPGKLGR